MFFGNMFFFIFSITADLNDLHTIKKRPWNPLDIICSCNKQHFGKILGNFHIVVIEMVVLLRVQYLQKCGRSISLIVTAGFVNLVQKHQRIGNLRLLKSHSDPAWHSSHISLSMTTDLSLVSHTAKADTHITLACSFRNRFGNGSLTGTWRSYQTEDRGFSLVCQLADRKKFHNSLFYILQAIMPLFQDLPCRLQILRIFRTLIPWKGKKCLDISPQNTAFCSIGTGNFESSDFFEDAVLHFLRCDKLFCFPSEFFCFICSVILSQFLTDQLQLLPQNIFTLILIYPFFQLLLKVTADIQHIDLIA